MGRNPVGILENGNTVGICGMATPTGFGNEAQGWRIRLPWEGVRAFDEFNPTGVVFGGA